MMEAFRGIEDNQALTEMSSEEDDDEGKQPRFLS